MSYQGKIRLYKVGNVKPNKKHLKQILKQFITDIKFDDIIKEEWLIHDSLSKNMVFSLLKSGVNYTELNRFKFIEEETGLGIIQFDTKFQGVKSTQPFLSNSTIGKNITDFIIATLKNEKQWEKHKKLADAYTKLFSNKEDLKTLPAGKYIKTLNFDASQSAVTVQATFTEESGLISTGEKVIELVNDKSGDKLKECLSAVKLVDTVSTEVKNKICVEINKIRKLYRKELGLAKKKPEAIDLLTPTNASLVHFLLDDKTGISVDLNKKNEIIISANHLNFTYDPDIRSIEWSNKKACDKIIDAFRSMTQAYDYALKIKKIIEPSFECRISRMKGKKDSLAINYEWDTERYEYSVSPTNDDAYMEQLSKKVKSDLQTAKQEQKNWHNAIKKQFNDVGIYDVAKNQVVKLIFANQGLSKSRIRELLSGGYPSRYEKKDSDIKKCTLSPTILQEIIDQLTDAHIIQDRQVKGQYGYFSVYEAGELCYLFCEQIAKVEHETLKRKKYSDYTDYDWLNEISKNTIGEDFINKISILDHVGVYFCEPTAYIHYFSDIPDIGKKYLKTLESLEDGTKKKILAKITKEPKKKKERSTNKSPDIQKDPANDIQERTANDSSARNLKCEVCLFADHCDGWEFSPFCMAELGHK